MTLTRATKIIADLKGIPGLEENDQRSLDAAMRFQKREKVKEVHAGMEDVSLEDVFAGEEK